MGIINWIGLGIGIAIVYAFIAFVVYNAGIKVMQGEYSAEENASIIGALWPLSLLAIIVWKFGEKILFPPAKKLADWIT